ncbi:uncharacterized protein [Dysidea avara]|uniref:uncharacterized protein isoform X2 n=1 Tax=Dysidea avara TaxID=196820 RepID=UPI0033199D41
MTEVLSLLLVILCEEPYPLVCDDIIRTHPPQYYYNKTCQLLPSDCYIPNETAAVFNNLSHCTAMCNNTYNTPPGRDKHDSGINLIILVCGGGVLGMLVVIIVTIVIIRRRCHSRTKRYYEQVLALINEEDLDDDDVIDDVSDDDVMIT